MEINKLQELSSTIIYTDKINMIINYVCNEYSITKEMLPARTKKQDICDARHIIAALLSVIFERRFTQQQITKFVPLHDRTMVSYARQKVSCLMLFNKVFRTRMERILNSLEPDEEERTLLTSKLVDFPYRQRKIKTKSLNLKV